MATEKEILLCFLNGDSQRRIASSLKVSRNTVSRIVAAYMAQKLEASDVSGLTSEALHERLFPTEILAPQQVIPDYEYVHRELLKDGVTVKQLWEEYVMDCRESGNLYFRYTQFCKKYRDYVDTHRLTMHIRHKPGEKVMVDWAGKTIPFYNPVTGEVSKAYLFVSTLPFSMYCYAEVFPNMKEASWIAAHVHMMEYYGGSARILVSDNLKTGIISNRKHEDPIANKVYQELADYYSMALLPTRVLAPKDKAAVEGSVGQLTTHIIGKLRNSQFFNISEVNAAVWKLLKDFNAAPFQKKEGSRYSVFLAEELPFLQALPRFPYEYAEWRKSTVQMNYHITVDHQNYSVPHTYVRKRVDVRLTNALVEIYYNGKRIASHKRLTGRRGQYSTVTEHMPLRHQLYSEWDGSRFRRWAKKCGPSVLEVIEKMLTGYRIEQQAYKGCIALLKLADKFGTERLEDACHLALTKMPSPRYKLIRGILDSNLDMPYSAEALAPTAPGTASLGGALEADPSSPNDNAYIRGAAYYGGDHHEE